MLGGTLTMRNGETQAGEWLFPAVLLADLDLKPINLADQFAPTYLFVDIFPTNAGGLPPGTAYLGLGLRLGFLQLRYPNLRTCQKNQHVPSKVNRI